MADHTPLGIGKDLLTEILLWLPAKSVIRSGAVCKAWRRITTDPAFLSEHARRRPVEALLYTEGEIAGGGLELDALPIGAVQSQEPAAGRRRLVHYPKKKRGRGTYGEQYCLLLASCDGLLLFRKAAGHYVVCNPTTRRWAELPRLTTMTDAGGRRSEYLNCEESGFYFHPPSGEYRLLCHCTSRMPMVRTVRYAVLSVGADEPRWLDMEAAPIRKEITAPMDKRYYKLALYRNFMTPAALHGRLHWLLHPEAGLTDQMVAFDTAAETFRTMASPAVTNKYFASLLVTDGLLMASEFTHSSVDLWVLDGYGGGAMDDGGIRWELRHRVVLPWQHLMPQLPRLVAGGDDGDAILGTLSGLAVYNVRRKTVRVVADVETAGDLNLSRRLFRESLVHHTFLQDQGRPSSLPLLRFLP